MKEETTIDFIPKEKPYVLKKTRSPGYIFNVQNH